MIKFTVKQEDLLGALKKAKGTLACNDTRVILKNFAIKASENGRLSIVSTDLDLTSVCECDAIVEIAGATTVPGDQFLGIIQRAGSLDVTLEVDNNKAKISSGKFVAQLSCLAAEDFPSIADFPNDSKQEVQREKFLDTLNRISFSICDNEARKNLLNVMIDNGEMFASDAKVTTATHLDFAQDLTDIMIPSQAVRDLVRILRSSDSDILEIGKTSSFLMFRIDTDVFISRLSTSKFPDIRKRGLIPSANNDIHLTVERQALLDAVRRVSCTSSEKSRAVSLVAGAKNLNLSSYDRSGNSSQEDLDASLDRLVEGSANSISEKMTFIFDHQYLEDVLSSLSTDSVTFKIADNIRMPVRLEEPNFIVMIMRLSDTVLKEQDEEEDEKKQPSVGEAVDEV